MVKIMEKPPNYQPAFIVGSPRSGTTLLGDILDLHPQIARWYEPYFVIDRYFSHAPHDCRNAADATSKVKEFTTKAFDQFQLRTGCDVLVDKTPRNCLKLPFLLEIFPHAKIIHVIRDGRDTILSIHREWQKRNSIVQNRKNIWHALRIIKRFLDRQYYLDHKLAALRFEIGDTANIFRGRQYMLYRVRRWQGRVGWGPQFEEWQSVINEVTDLEFNAWQWVKCVEAVTTERLKLNDSQFLEIRYEEFLQEPVKNLRIIFNFLNLRYPQNFESQIPTLKEKNYGKWQTAFTAEEKARIGPIINALLQQTEYAHDTSWYKNQQPVASISIKQQLNE